MEQAPEPQTKTDGIMLDGQLLIAMPAMADERFARTVIYMCAHSEEGAMGLVINRAATHIGFGQLLEQLDILSDDEVDDIVSDITAMPVHIGGPVETGRGFVLHTSDYFAAESTMPIDEDVSLTATIDILKAIARGRGPDRALLALGYAGWAPGQLESEIQANGWLNCPADPHLVFETDVEDKYTLALSSLGVDPTHLVSDAGHA